MPSVDFQIPLPPNKNFPPIEINLENLSIITQHLDDLSNGQFIKCVKSARLALRNKHNFVKENQLAWAIVHLEKRLEKNEYIDFSNDETTISLNILHGYFATLEYWYDHVEIKNIAKELCSTFQHTLSTLMIAEHFIRYKGRNVVLHPPKIGGGRSPDLCINLSNEDRKIYDMDRLYAEIKCPKQAQWPNVLTDHNDVKRLVKKCIRDSKDQISKNQPGILVIATTCFTRDSLEIFRIAIDDYFKHNGKAKTHYHAISVITIYKASVRNTEPGIAKPESSHFIDFRMNPYFNHKSNKATHLNN